MNNNVAPNDLVKFMAVLSEGGLRAATKRLGVAPSKISTIISRVEGKLGVPLLLRTTRSIKPTEQRQAFAERVQRFIISTPPASKLRVR